MTDPKPTPTTRTRQPRALTPAQIEARRAAREARLDLVNETPQACANRLRDLSDTLPRLEDAELVLHAANLLETIRNA